MKTFLGTCFLSLFCLQVYSQVLWDQSDATDYGYQSYFYPTGGQYVIYGDDFQVPVNKRWEITAIAGQFFTLISNVPIQNFTIEIYNNTFSVANGGNIPGAKVFGVSAKADPPVDWDDIDVFPVFPLPEPVVLPPGRYWVGFYPEISGLKSQYNQTKYEGVVYDVVANTPSGPTFGGYMALRTKGLGVEFDDKWFTTDYLAYSPLTRLELSFRIYGQVYELDESAPELKELTVEPKPFDVANPENQLEFLFKFEDDKTGANVSIFGVSFGVGFQGATLKIRSPGGQQTVEVQVSSGDRVSGTPVNGIYTLSVTASELFPSNTVEGTWQIYNMTLWDNAGPSVNYRSYSYIVLFSLIGSSRDIEIINTTVPETTQATTQQTTSQTAVSDTESQSQSSQTTAETTQAQTSNSGDEVNDSSSDSGSNTVAIIGGVGGGVVLLVLIVVIVALVILLRKPVHEEHSDADIHMKPVGTNQYGSPDAPNGGNTYQSTLQQPPPYFTGTSNPSEPKQLSAGPVPTIVVTPQGNNTGFSTVAQPRTPSQQISQNASGYASFNANNNNQSDGRLSAGNISSANSSGGSKNNIPTPYGAIPEGVNDSRSGIAAVQPSSGEARSNFELDFYELEFMQEIGRGAYGVVFKGRWRGGVVAIKQLLNMGHMSPKELQDFKSEAAVMCKLRPHVNVVQFLGITSQPELCIVTEFLDKGSLYGFLHSEAKIDTNMIMNLVKGIAAGMLHLHREGIVHRDLAARNILLGSGLQVKISDFGLSRPNDGATGNQTKSDTGPLKWMAPEAIRLRVYSTMSDVWSFGVTIWEIITRDDPYPTLDPVQTALAVTHNELRLTIPEYCPPVLDKIMRGCFQTDPKDRPDFGYISRTVQDARLEEWTSPDIPTIDPQESMSDFDGGVPARQDVVYEGVPNAPPPVNEYNSFSF